MLYFSTRKGRGASQTDLNCRYLKLPLHFFFPCLLISTKWVESPHFRCLDRTSTKCFGWLEAAPPVCSLEDLALVEGFADMLELSLPGQVLLHHGLALLTVGVQLAPGVRLVVDLPIVRKLQRTYISSQQPSHLCNTFVTFWNCF